MILRKNLGDRVGLNPGGGSDSWRGESRTTPCIAGLSRESLGAAFKTERRSLIPHKLACFSLFTIGELTLVNEIFSKESETTLLL